MKRRSLKRVLSLREHEEGRARASLAQTVQELSARQAARVALLERRRQEEKEVTTGTSESDTLRRQHAHLVKLALELEELDASIRVVEAELAEKEEAWLEARRLVKSLEMLLERRDVAAAAAERLRNQKLLDSLAIRQRRTPPGGQA